MSTIGCNNTTSPRLRLLIDCITGRSKRHPRFNKLNCLVQRLSARLHYPDAIRVRERFITDVVRLIQVTVEAAVIQRYVDVDDVAIDQASRVGNPVADDLVNGGADGFRETVIVQRRWVGLVSIVS